MIFLKMLSAGLLLSCGKGAMFSSQSPQKNIHSDITTSIKENEHINSDNANSETSKTTDVSVRNSQERPDFNQPEQSASNSTNAQASANSIVNEPEFRESKVTPSLVRTPIFSSTTGSAAVAAALPKQENLEPIPGSFESIRKSGGWGLASCPANKFAVGILGNDFHADTLLCASLRTSITHKAISVSQNLSAWQSMNEAGSILQCATEGIIRKIIGPTYTVNQILCEFPKVEGESGSFRVETHSVINLSYHRQPAQCFGMTSLLVGAGSPISADWHFDRATCRQIVFVR